MILEIFNDLRAGFTVPNILLTSLLLLGGWVLVKAQKNPSFEISHMLVDERGKPSAARLAVFVALGTSTYILVRVIDSNAISAEYLFYIYLAYLLTWASSKGLEKLAAGVGSRFGGGGGSGRNDQQEPNVIYSQSCPTQQEERPERYDRKQATAENKGAPRFTMRDYDDKE